MQQVKEVRKPSQPAPTTEAAPNRAEQARAARDGERAAPPPPRPQPVAAKDDGLVGSVGGQQDFMAFRNLARGFKSAPPVEGPAPPVTPQPAPPPKEGGLHDINGPTPDLHERLSDVKDPQGQPLDGHGVTIGMIDEYNERDGKVGPHAAGTQETAQSVAPGADVDLYGMDGTGPALRPDANEVHLPADLPDDPAALNQALRELDPTMLSTTTDRLNQLADDPNRDPNMRVLNMSLGSAKGYYYETVLSKLNERNPDGSYKNPRLRDTVLAGESSDPPAEAAARRIAEYTNAQLDDPDSAYSQAVDEYQQVTEKLSSPPHNISIVVAAGNAGPVPISEEAKKKAPLDYRELWEQASPGSCSSDFARSGNVIVVGAYDQRAGHVYDRSAWTDGGANQPGGPTQVLAPGNGTRNINNPSTSAATPYVAGTIALMLQANPALTPDQIREILSASATPLEGVEPRQQGDGLISAEEAVRMAAEVR